MLHGGCHIQMKNLVDTHQSDPLSYDFESRVGVTRMWHSYGIFQFPSVLQRAKSGQEAALKSKTERKKFDIPEDFMREIKMLWKKLTQNIQLVPLHFFLTLVVSDLGNQIYFWVICDPTVKNTAISAHFGGLIAGLVTGFIVLSKFQESWGQQKIRLVFFSR